MWFEWCDQLNVSSKWWPKNLKELSLQSSTILSIISPPIESSQILRCLPLFFNKINLVFLAFRVKRFAENQSADFWSSRFAFQKRNSGSSEDSWKVVSSANKIVKKSEDWAKSFMYIRKSKGPATDPCGIPQVIPFSFKNVPQGSWSNCTLFVY